MTTKHIEEFLAKHYPDQSLANLQCATENGSLTYGNPCGCLLHYQKGSYVATKFYSDFQQLAACAEREFQGLCGPDMATDAQRDAQRREALLPLILKEWVRRAQPVPVTFETPAKVEVTVCRDQTA